MKKNTFFLIISAIAIALVIGLAFVFVDQNKLLVHVNEVFIPYLSGKIIYGVALIFVTLWVFLTEKARGHALALILATYVVQFVPLLLRLGLELKADKTVIMLYEILLLALPLIAYLIAVSLIYYQDKKMVASDHKYEGGTIEVVSEKEAEERNYRNIKKESEDTIPVVSEEESEANNLK